MAIPLAAILKSLLAKGNAPLKVLITWLIFLCYNAIILWLAVRNGTGMGFIIHPVDKILHAVEYGLLCFLGVYAFSHFYENLLTKKVLLIAFLYAGAIGLLTEAIQYHIPTRFFSLGDLFFDLLGAGLVALFLLRKT